MLWASTYPDLVVPVYISTGPQSSIFNTGLTLGQAETVLVEIIRRHNESSVGPVFFYAGTTASDMDYSAVTAIQQFANRPFGITFDAYACGVGMNEPCPPGRYGCADNGEVVAKARVTLAPAGCGNGVGVGSHTLTNPDVATTLLHEFGHALGLQHSNKSLAVCNTSNTKLFGGDPDGNDGVMHEVLSGNVPAVREWRRDDIAGLMAVYASPLTAELAWWNDQNFPAGPNDADLTSIVGLATTRPATLSSAPDIGVNSIYLATTDSSNQVVLLTNDGGGFGVPEIVENGPVGRTWGNPVVAVGLDAVLVYWTAGERQDDATITHRWGVKSMQAQSWMYQEGPDATEVKRIGAGYASTDVFVLSTLTDSYSLPVIMTVSAADGTLIERIELDGPAFFDIGSAACFGDSATSYCAIPYSANSLDGVDLGWLNIGVTRREVECGNGIRQGLEECDDRNAVDNDECLNSCMNAVCGDGVVHTNFEECDDGNANAGDGCDEQCASEDVGTETGTGDAGDQLPSDGCNCHTGRQNGTVPLALPWLVVASTATRRLRRAAARCVC